MVAPARIFVNRLLNNLRKCQGRISINLEINLRHTFKVYVDASLSGVGGWGDNNAYAVTRHLLATWNLSITQLEMLNVLISLRTFGHMWANKSVVRHIDNNAAMYALTYGQIKDPFMQSISRSILLVAASKDIQMDFVNIAGNNNNTKADILSRVFEKKWSQERFFC